MACSSEPGDPPSGSGGQTEYEIHRYPGARGVFVLVVDDAPTPEAASLRGRVAEAFRKQALREELDRRGGSACPFDPGRLYLGDSEVVIVRPSYSGDQAIMTSVDMPGLGWTSDSPSIEQPEAWGNAVEAALEDAVALAGAPYRPLERLHELLALITGERVAKSPLERAFVEGLPVDSKSGLSGALYLSVFIATTRDDASPENPSSYAQLDRYVSPLPSATRPFALRNATLYLPTPDQSCVEIHNLSGRFGEWLSAPSQPGLGARDYRCEEFAIEHRVVERSFCDANFCMGRPIEVDADGRSSCIAYGEVDSNAPCPNELGWFDPLQETPALALESAPRRADLKRLCEIRELSGKALEACRFDLSCQNCEPGWCVTEVPELLESKACPSATPRRLPFRFLGELPRRPEIFRLRCNYSGPTGASAISAR